MLPLYGDLPMDQWPDDGVPDPDGVWADFVLARGDVADGHVSGAIAIWRSIAADESLEARHRLQAWTFLREHGAQPDASIAKRVEGMVVHVPMQGTHDVLAAYRDGSVRYLNHTGAATVVDAPTPEVTAAARALLVSGDALALQIGPWEGPLPSLPADAARLMVLTPSGPHFGQGPFDQLAGDPLGRPVVDAATRLLQVVVDLPRG